ncbi:MAG: hypothetical protein EPO25_16185, partial [Gammaproteobacteria bacterium]
TLLGIDTSAPYTTTWNDVLAGSYTLTARSTDDAGATTTSSPVNVTVQTSDGTAIRINAGGQSYIDLLGQTWVPDTGYFNIGNAKSSSAQVAGTIDDPIYQKWREGPSTTPQMAYTVPVQNGDYRITLHFAEMTKNRSKIGARVFDVNIENVTVLSNFDIFAQAGARSALALTFNLAVADGQLTVLFVPRQAQPIIGAIEIEQQ